MSAISPRLAHRVRNDFSNSASEAVELLDGLALDERVQAAAILFACGDLNRLLEAVLLAELDWRDLLVVAGLADEDWPTKLVEEFGSPP